MREEWTWSKKIEVCNRELENIKSNQPEMKNKIIEKYTVEIKSRINYTEKPMSELEDRAVEILILNKKKEIKIKTNEKSLRDL